MFPEMTKGFLMSLTKEGFSSGPKMTTIVIVDGVGLDKGSGSGVGQAFFKGDGLIVMDLDKHLRCLSRNPTFNMGHHSAKPCFCFVAGR